MGEHGVGRTDGSAEPDEAVEAVNVARIIEGHDESRTALVSRNRTIAYDELNDLVARVRGGLAGLGIGHGDRVALVCGNGHPFVVAYLAAVGLGAVVVPLNPGSPAAELGRELSVVRPVAAVVDRSASGAWTGIDADAVSSVRHVVTVDGDAIAVAVAFDTLAESDPLEVRDVAPDHVAVLMFTSGTAGAPKAAMLTHANLLANIEQSRSVPSRITAEDVVYGVIPAYHIFGLNVVVGISLAAGAAVVLVQRFDPATALESIRNRGVTVIPGAPAMWVAFAHFDEAPADAFATVRLALSGAAKLPVSVSERMREHFGVTIHEGYGLTEASPVVTSSVGLEPRFGSVGRVLGGIELRIVDDDGGDALVGDAGEILVRGANVFAGYLDDPDATGRVLTPDGWLRTGDIGMCDTDGRLYLVDRAKDLIIVLGFNVFPAEVEDVLAGHPDVAEVGVIGVPHPHTGEAVKAFVVLRPGATSDEDALVDYARDRLARYKCPTKILLVDELPRNATGKLVRHGLDILEPTN
ncbi:MAG: AMP-binding protein [Acidimicrobiia bacterium]|nr:AMP-binding protein [Acidimicrobiia bacterium]